MNWPVSQIYGQSADAQAVYKTGTRAAYLLQTGLCLVLKIFQDLDLQEF